MTRGVSVPDRLYVSDHDWRAWRSLDVYAIRPVEAAHRRAEFAAFEPLGIVYRVKLADPAEHARLAAWLAGRRVKSR